ncbi:hypothetical protein AX14_013578 [Amanita brunnescens Koide BX004]|nr:hypothetical protein AX14_013578 [Amanita brunnescens Koide BX004]
MSQFHLRPVADNSPSSSPTASTSSPDRRSPHKASPDSSSSQYTNARQRRPLSPRLDLDLTHTSDMPQRKYPAPPTGHELMAMFPPAPPETPLETRGGPTSGFFQRQERAFFAQAGKEIFRVRVEIDLPPHASDMEGGHSKARARHDANAPRSWPPQLPAHPTPNASIPHHSPVHAASQAVPLANPNGRPNQRGGVPVTPVPLYPLV